MSHDSGTSAPPLLSFCGVSGMLLHVTSLSSLYGIDCVGPGAIASINQHQVRAR
jgi:hypothetical protein